MGVEPLPADLVPIVLAGGSGTRLWPVSRAAMPKHLVELVGAESLLEATVRRVRRASGSGSVVTVAAAGQAVLVRRQLDGIDAGLRRDLLLEPEPRNTAAAVALGALWVAEHLGPETLLWVCPSDHLMLAPEAMLAAVATGSPAAAAGRIVTFGIQPTRPETGFGWIAVGDRLDQEGVSDVRRFVEKPEAERARAMLASGDHLWNSGMFLMRADVVIGELQRFEPELLAGVRHAMAGLAAQPEHLVPAERYGAIKSTPIDKAVMERSERVAVVPCDPRWSDVGSWHALWELMDKDADGNVVTGDGLTIRSKGNLVKAEHRLVGLVGVSGLAVIETADAVLVADRTDSEGVKALVGLLTRHERREAVAHLREFHPWGSLTLLAERPGYRVQELVLDPLQRLPSHRPRLHDMHWHVVAGTAAIRLGDRELELAAGQSVLVPGGAAHRLTNATEQPLRLLEIRLGDEPD